MTRYAAKTEVSSEASRMEIERTLTRYGADAFSYGWQGKTQTMVSFRAHDRYVRFVLTLPDPDLPEFKSYRRGAFMVDRAPEAARKLWEQACRQRWRTLALVVKAKLEAVECGISEFEDEFLANIVLPDGQLLGQAIRPQIAATYATGNMPPMLPDYSEGR
ncbi:hypothetical protein IP68_02355 [Blastomonas sp. AAP25]|uniref:hypothetical protein n=1 Tax=Blastomonas sp. AAP25 TaxID=1523416 RepID=UPI0006B8CDF1|nr:hypothetical protein [Blastomonas sp. AAP25]KPF76756.1 hypothetical protein IP68_02355 [Blastomonas sp. AAP25]